MFSNSTKSPEVIPTPRHRQSNRHRKARKPTRAELEREKMEKEWGNAVFVCESCGHSEEVPWAVIWDIQEMTHGYVGIWEDPPYPCTRCGAPYRFGSPEEAPSAKSTPKVNNPRKSSQPDEVEWWDE